MTAPALSWGLFGRGAHEAGRSPVPEQAGPERVPGSERVPGQDSSARLDAERADRPEPSARVVLGERSSLHPAALDQAALDEAALDQGALDEAALGRAAAALEAAGPAERALLAAARELGVLHPLDRVEQVLPLDRHEAPEPEAAPEATVAVPVATDGPSAAPPVLDVLPSSGVRRRRSARDAALPLVLMAELLTGVWLGSAQPWRADAPDPLQARFSSTAPATDDLRLPEPVAPALVPVSPGAGALRLRTPSSATTPAATRPERSSARPVDPFSPR